MDKTLANTVDDFISTKFKTKRQKSTVLNLFIGKEDEGEREPFSFLKQKVLADFVNKSILNEEVLDRIPAAIKESTLSYPNEKNTAINLFKMYIAFLEQNYNVHMDIEFPPVFNSPFDRQMYIVKSLHERQYNAAEIAEQLWLSERTIEKDIEQLEEGINVLEQSLKIRREIVVKNKTLNSIHPLFLSANLSQIVVLLQGLEYMAREKAYSEYAVRLASNIWNELSEYGRSRIMKVTDLLGLNINWFKVLEQNRNIGLYSSEIDCSNVEGAGNVLDFLKNGKSCTIELENESGSVILEKCQITKFNDPWLIILHNCEEIKVNIDSVVSAYEYSYQIY